jgi:hypothetical protein
MVVFFYNLVILAKAIPKSFIFKKRIEEFLASDQLSETKRDNSTMALKGNLEIQRIYNYDKMDASLYEKLVKLSLQFQ